MLSNRSGLAPPISIHAPLAGSDPRAPVCDRDHHQISIHAPLAGSDRRAINTQQFFRISIHAPLAGSDVAVFETVVYAGLISIHAPLAGSDVGLWFGCRYGRYFNPRSPRGERPDNKWNAVIEPYISIHAPLAGSDVIWCAVR